MQIRRIWEFWGIRMTRTLQHSKQRKGRPQPASFKADRWTAFLLPLSVHFGDYACFVSQSLLVMVIAFSMLSTTVTITNKAFSGILIHKTKPGTSVLTSNYKFNLNLTPTSLVLLVPILSEFAAQKNPGTVAAPGFCSNINAWRTEARGGRP